MRSRRRTLSAAALLVAAGTVLTACSGGGSSDSAGGLDEGVVSQPAPEGEARLDAEADVAGGEAPSTVGTVDVSAEDRDVIYTVDLVVEVDDVAEAADEAGAVAARFGGYVQSESTFGLSPEPLPVEPDAPIGGIVRPTPEGQAVLVLRVPADAYEEAVDALEELGETVSRSRNAQDVTEEVVDVESRIETQQASIDRLQELLTQATDIGDILAIETELTRRLADLESLQARLEQLGNLTELATITVTLVPPETVVEEGTGFLAGLRAGWRAFVRAAELGVTALGAFLPFMVFFALLLLPLLVWLVVRHRRRRARAAAVATETATAQAPTAQAPATPTPATPTTTADEASGGRPADG
jgi:hypothetical protein